MPVMKKTLLAVVVVLAATALAGRAQSPSQARRPNAAAGVTIEQLIDIRHPSSPMWSPDGRSVVFLWDRAGVSKVYVVPVEAGARPSAPRELPDAGASL